MATAPRASRMLVGLFVIVVATSFVVRWRAAGADGLWLDEAVSLHVAQQPVSITTLWANDDPTPPLYYLLLCGWTRLFGDSLETARLLSVLLATATTALVFDLGRRHFSAETGLIAAALYAGSRLQIHYGHELRCYALAGLLCVASFDLFFSLAKRPAWPTALGIAVVNAALLWTHYLTIFALTAQAGGAALYFIYGNSTFVPLYVTSQALGAAMFSPLLLQATHSALTEKDWIGAPTIGRVMFIMRRLAGSATLLTAYGAIFACVAWLRRNLAPATSRPQVATLALWAFLPTALAFAASFFRQVLLDRYVLYSSPALSLLVAHAIAIAPMAVRARVLVATGVIAASFATALADPIRRHDWRAAVAIVRSEQAVGSSITVAPYWQYRPLAYYLDHDGFRDYEHTRERLLAAGVSLVEDIRTQTLPPRRQVLLLAPEATPPRPELDEWLSARGFVTIREESLHGLLLLVVQPRPIPDDGSRSPNAPPPR